MKKNTALIPIIHAAVAFAPRPPVARLVRSVFPVKPAYNPFPIRKNKS